MLGELDNVTFHEEAVGAGFRSLRARVEQLVEEEKGSCAVPQVRPVAVNAKHQRMAQRIRSRIRAESASQ